MRMNISVPDTLATQVREHNLPISAICQRALQAELASVLTAKEADDIQVFGPGQQASPDPATWPDIDPAKPMLAYFHRAEFGDGWTLWHNVGGELRDYFIPGGPDQAAWALQRARAWLQIAGGPQMEKITVDVGEPSVTVGFTGRWLLHPDSDETRTSEDGHDAGAYWGVALTQRGRVAVYTAHCNDRWPAVLQDYDSLDQAAAHVPADIIALAARELGEERVVWRDI